VIVQLFLTMEWYLKILYFSISLVYPGEIIPIFKNGNYHSPGTTVQKQFIVILLMISVNDNGIMER
jgi:hypothetical protein